MSEKTVFISYSHDCDDHRERVLALSERLRDDGIVTLLDQYVNGSPPEGWPRWMLNGLDAAASVIVVCTGTYYRRFRGYEEPGKGVDWEGALITQEIYDSRSTTLKFVPVLFSSADETFIPERSGRRSWRTGTGRGAKPSSRGPSTARARASRPPFRPIRFWPRPSRASPTHEFC